MVDQARALVETQIRRVRRRMFWNVIAESVMLGWAFAFGLATCWFLVRPFTGSDEAVRWGIAGGLFGFGTLVGIGLAWARRPSAVAASLALDARFGLKERVTTFLALSNEQLATAAGQALLHDVSEQVAKLQIATEFPFGVRLKQAAVPAIAFCIAALACLFDPLLGSIHLTPRVNADPPPTRVIDAKEVQQKLDELKKNIEKRNQEEALKSAELKELEQEFAKLIKEPIDGKNEEKVREQLDKLHTLEEKMKERLDAMREKAARIDVLKDQLKQLAVDKDKLSKDGPAKDFEDALIKGDFEKAKAALERLAKDLKNEKLDANQRKQLAEQLEKLRDNMKKLADNDDIMKQLKKQLDEKKIDKEAFDRAMERLKDLQDLTDLVGDAKDALDKAGDKGGKEALDDLLKRLGEMELTEKEIQDLLADQRDVQDAMRLLMQAVDDFGDGQNDGLGGGGMPGARRPIDPKDPDGKIKNERSMAQLDAKAKLRVTGYARGGTFNKIPAKAVEGAFRQAAQNAPEVIERQRIPDDYKETAEKYFDRLRNER
jgi:hypothetical protein